MERKNSSNSEKEKTASVIHGNRVWFFGDLVFLSEWKENTCPPFRSVKGNHFFFLDKDSKDWLESVPPFVTVQAQSLFNVLYKWIPKRNCTANTEV